MNVQFILRTLCLSLGMLALMTGCESTGTGSDTGDTKLLYANIAGEPEGGGYYVGRRYFKENYYYWGYIREPRKPWGTAKLVMMNENKVLAPDRAANTVGSDNNYEYYLKGRFSGDTVYEASSNSFYPEFVLESYQLVNTNPPSIFEPGKRNPEAQVFR